MFTIVLEVSESILNYFFLFSLSNSSAVISTFLSSTLLIHSSASVILLLILSTVFLNSVIVFFVTVCFFFISCRSLLSVLNYSCIFSILFSRFWIIFIIFTLNSFSGSLPLSSLFIWSCGCLPCSFIHKIFLYLFILSHLHGSTYSFPGVRDFSQYSPGSQQDPQQDFHASVKRDVLHIHLFVHHFDSSFTERYLRGHVQYIVKMW